MNLSSQEQSLLKDQLNHEKVCIQKYQNYAQQATDQQLKQLFQNYAQQEQNHYNTIKQILNGQVPSTNQSQAGQSQQSAGQAQSQSPAGATMSTGLQNPSATAGSTTRSANVLDAYMCDDMLMTEKYVSGAYDTAIFEFSQANVRQALNHIQKEEQRHGEGIFNYMQSTGMYNAQS